MSLTLARKQFALIVPLLVISACGKDKITNPTPANVVGSYHASQFFTTPTGGATRDELAAGSTLSIALNADGTTAGLLHIASPVFNADMAGTWDLEGNTLVFTQAADTFVRNMIFTVSGTAPNGIKLTGDQTFSGTRIQIVLEKPDPI